MKSNTFIKNKGITQTYIYNKNNKKGIASEIDWDYDGKRANISVDLQSNTGDEAHYDIKLDNNDLAQILSIPSVNTPIDKRLLNDFKPTRKYRTLPPDLNMTMESMNMPNQSVLDTHISSPHIQPSLVLPLDIVNRKKQKYTKTRRQMKSKSKKNRRR